MAPPFATAAPQVGIFDDHSCLTSSFGWAWRRASSTGMTKRLSFEDVRQEFMLRVCRLQEGPGRYDPSKAGPGTYLRMIASQTILREVRSLRFRGRGKADVGEKDDIAQEIEGALPGALSDSGFLESDEIDHVRVHEALMSLTDERDILLLVRLSEGGETYASMGQELGLSRERTRQLYLRALDRLRLAMGVEG